MVKERDLNTVGAVTTNDFVRTVLSDGSSTKSLIGTLAQAIVESYTGSTLDGTARSLKSALDAHGLSFAEVDDSIEALQSWINGEEASSASGPIQVEGVGNSLGIEFKNTNTDLDIGLRVNSDGTVAGLYSPSNEKFLIQYDGTNAFVNGKPMYTLEPTSSITDTTGTMSAKYFRQYGNVVHFVFVVKNSSAVAAGSNIYEGTLNTDALKPVITARGVGYLGSGAYVGQLAANGNIVVRNTSGSSLAANTDVTIVGTYLVS